MSDSKFSAALKNSTRVTNPALGVLRVGRFKWAIGLEWTVTGATTVSAGLVRKKAKVQNNDLFLVKRPNIYALGNSQLGHKKGMPALALTLAQNEEVGLGNFIGIFEIDLSGRYYFLSLRDGVVDPTTDRIIDDGRLAQAEFADLLDQAQEFEWTKIYAPSDWAIDNSIDSRDGLEVLLPRRGKKVFLTPVSRRRELLLILGIIMLGIISYFGYETYESYQASILRQILLEHQRENALALQRRLASQALRLPPATWSNQPHGVALLDQCVSEMLELPANPPGWSLKDIHCNAYSITESFMSDGGTTNWIAPFVDHTSFGEPEIVLNTAQSVSVSWPINSNLMPHYTGYEDGLDLTAVKSYLISQMGELFEPITISPVEYPEIEAQKNGRNVVVKAPWTSASISFSSYETPNSFDQILGRMPIFVISDIEYNPLQNGVWLVSGSIYHNSPQPIAKPTKTSIRLPFEGIPKS